MMSSAPFWLIRLTLWLNDPADLVDVLGLVAIGKVKPQIEVYPLDDINRVLVRLADGKVRHRAVVTHN